MGYSLTAFIYRTVPAMTFEKDYSIEELEARYNDIAVLYDLSEELLATAESELVKDHEAQLALVEPLIHEIGEATDVLTEEFTTLAEQSKKKILKRGGKPQVEAALRRVFTAINEYQTRAKKAGKKAFNLADAVVQKIQRQVERVVEIFLEFIHVSLTNLMNKAELEALRVRNANIALFMHQQALTQHQGQ
jgi:hypothetical protein